MNVYEKMCRLAVDMENELSGSYYIEREQETDTPSEEVKDRCYKKNAVTRILRVTVTVDQ